MLSINSASSLGDYDDQPSDRLTDQQTDMRAIGKFHYKQKESVRKVKRGSRVVTQHESSIFRNLISLGQNMKHEAYIPFIHF